MSERVWTNKTCFPEEYKHTRECADMFSEGTIKSLNKGSTKDRWQKENQSYALWSIWMRGYVEEQGRESGGCVWRHVPRATPVMTSPSTQNFFARRWLSLSRLSFSQGTRKYSDFRKDLSQWHVDHRPFVGNMIVIVLQFAWDLFLLYCSIISRVIR